MKTDIKLFRGKNIGPQRQEFMKQHLRLEEVPIEVEDIARRIRGHIELSDGHMHGFSCAAMDIYNFILGEAIRDELEDAVNRIIAHQNNTKLHPLTCGNDSTHTPLIPVIENQEVVLMCADCDYKQTNLPDL